MAKIGMKNCVYRKHIITLNDDGTETTTYGETKRMGGSISASIAVRTATGRLYYDDALGEYVEEFVDGTSTMVLDDLEDDAEVDLFGATKKEDGSIVNKGTDEAAWIEQGFLLVRAKGNVRQYRGFVLKKVKYGVPGGEFQTKGESITFGTTTVSGVFTTDHTGEWRERGPWVKTENEAQTWLDNYMET